MRKIALGLAAAAAAIFGLGTAVSAGATVPVSLVLDTSTPDPGGQYTATYVNCFPGETVTFDQADSTPATQDAICDGVVPALQGAAQGLRMPRQVPSPGYGVATVTFIAPTAPNTYTVTGSGQQSNRPANAQFVIAQAPTTAPPTTAAPTTAAPTTAAPTTAGPTTAAPTTTAAGVGSAGQLPETGSSEAATTAAIAVTLLAGGLGLVVLASRRPGTGPA